MTAPATDFKPHLIVDTHFGNMPAAGFDVPAHWHASSALKWVFDEGVIDPANDFAYPVNVWARAEDPETGDAIERFPDLNFYFVPQAILGGGFIGAIAGLFGAAVPPNRMFGATSSPPMSCAEAISKFLLPRYRPALSDLRVPISSVSDEYAQLVKGLAKDFPAKVNLEPACVKLEYSLKGRPFEEEISALKLQWDAQDYGPMGVVVQTSWLLTIPIGLRAERGTLAAKRPLFNRVLRSSSVNPKWVELCQHVKGELQRNFDAMIQQGYDAIRAAGAVSRQISADNDAMLRSFEQQRAAATATWDRQRAADARSAELSINDKFSDYIRGVNTYEDPTWGRSQHSNEYEYVWKSTTGRHEYSNDPSFDPNVGSTESWQQLRRIG